jgi:hypothetical protein
MAAHHADLNQIQQTFTIGEADIEIARRTSPTAELRRHRPRQQRHHHLLWVFVLSWSSRSVGFQSRSETHKHRASLGKPWRASAG